MARFFGQRPVMYHVTKLATALHSDSKCRRTGLLIMKKGVEGGAAAAAARRERNLDTEKVGNGKAYNMRIKLIYLPDNVPV